MNTPIRRLAVVVFAMFTALLASTTWIQFVRADDLNADERNSRTLLRELGRARGPIVVAGTPVAESVLDEDEDVYEYQRTYPEPELYAHVTGYYSVFFGATGLEDAARDLLSGTADELFYRRLSDLLTGAEPRGAVVETTIDPQVQAAATEALSGQTGAVVALDPATGDVLAMVSSPDFDPNLLASQDREVAVTTRQQLLDDPEQPLVNRAIGGDLYPPGSVFKLVTAAAALESGDYEPSSVLPGPAELDLPLTSVTLPNSGGEPCGPNDEVSLTDAMRVSCNTAFGALGLQLGDDALREQAQAFGFGSALRIPLRVTPSTVPEEMNEPQTAQAAIGQFDVRVTPLQVAMIAAAIANDGALMEPNLVRAVRSQDLETISQPQPTELSEAVSPEAADALAEMMTEVVESGTGRAAQIDGVEVAGKTGTAQHARERAPHAWFTGFAPVDDPQVAVAVVVEEGGTAGSQASGGRTAAPIARAVMEAVVSP